MNPIHTGLWRDYLRKRETLKENLKTVLSLKKEKKNSLFALKNAKKKSKNGCFQPLKVPPWQSHTLKIVIMPVKHLKAKLAFQRVKEKLELAELELNKSNEKYLKIRSSVIEVGLRKN